MTARFCYVLMCHTDPDAVERLVTRVRTLSPTADVVVRHSVPDLVDPDRLAELGARDLTSTTQIVWGDWSMAQAPLEALVHARATSDATHFVLLSGQDYPVRNLAEWEAQVVALGADALLDEFAPMPDDWAYRWWTLTVPHVGPRVVRRGLKWGWRHVWPAFRPALMLYQGRRDPRWILGIRRPGRLDRVSPVPIVKASLWMTLSARAVDSVRDRDAGDRRVRAFFHHVRIPDESYLPTLLHADPDLVVLDAPTTYARFAPDEWSPVDLDRFELRRVARTCAAFARKLPHQAPLDVLAAADALAARPIEECVPVHHHVPGEVRLTGDERQPAFLPAGPADGALPAGPADEQADYTGGREFLPG